MIFKHPYYGDLRVAVNEEQKLLFLMCDVTECVGLTPVQEMVRICDSEGCLHWLSLPLLKEGEILAPCCDEQLLADLLRDIDPKMQRMVEWVKNTVIPIAKDPKKRKKYLVKGVPFAEENTDRQFCLRLAGNALFINDGVCLTSNNSH